MKLEVQTDDTIERLDKFLAAKLPELSRSFIQKNIKAGSITVNQETTTTKYNPKVGDIIEISQTEQPKPDISPNKDVEFKIIDEQDDYVVIEKPSGLIVHPAEGINEPTLVNGLLAKYPELMGIGEDDLRPGIVHRLDKDVSGLMVVARTQEMFSHLKQQFQERLVTKEYTGLVHGVIEEEDGTIETPIGRSLSKSGKMAAHPSPKASEGRHTNQFNDRDAKTEYKVLERIKNYTKLLITIHTGRSHQIRVHMNSIEHPVAGDTLYTNKRVKQPALDRLFLHASKLGFTTLEGDNKEYESKLPKELKNFLLSF
jgi:23S rRNA pseudouridine1911/1915/1917 synthase